MCLELGSRIAMLVFSRLVCHSLCQQSVNETVSADAELATNFVLQDRTTQMFGPVDK